LINHAFIRQEAGMNQAIHQLLQLILQGITWFLRTLEALWVWSWSQIASVFKISWANMPAWKIVIGVVAIILLAAILVALFQRGLHAFRRIAAAFWTMALTLFGILVIVVMAGLLSRGVTWVVASVPDDFWAKLLSSS
jgi:hypothetical protein